MYSLKKNCCQWLLLANKYCKPQFVFDKVSKVTFKTQSRTGYSPAQIPNGCSSQRETKTTAHFGSNSQPYHADFWPSFQFPFFLKIYLKCRMKEWGDRASQTFHLLDHNGPCLPHRWRGPISKQCPPTFPGTLAGSPLCSRAAKTQTGDAGVPNATPPASYLTSPHLVQ